MTNLTYVHATAVQIQLSLAFFSPSDTGRERKRFSHPTCQGQLLKEQRAALRFSAVAQASPTILSTWAARRYR